MKTLGDMLRKAREARGLTLQDVVDKTKIRLHYLNSIEKGEFDQIPGEVYLKGFIRNYAAVVGLDEGEVLAKFNQIKIEQEDALKVELNVEVAKPAKPAKTAKPSTPAKPVKPVAPSISATKSVHPIVQQRSTNDIPWKVIIPSVLIILGLLAGIVGGWALIRQTKTQKAVAVVHHTTKHIVKNTTSSKKKVVVENNTELRVKATADVWIGLYEQETGRVIEEVELGTGDTRDWKIDRSLRLRDGNAGGLQVSAFGAPFKYYGKDGEVIDLTFSPQDKK